MALIKYFILIALVSYAFIMPGKVNIEWLGCGVEFSIGVFFAGLSVLLSIYWVIKAIFSKICGFVRDGYLSNKIIKTFDAVTYVVIALLRSDYKESAKQTARFEKLLKDGHPLLTWITGCHLALKGDSENANLLFYGLSGHNKFGFLGAYSMYKLRLRSGQSAAALKVIESYMHKNSRDNFFVIDAIKLAIKDKNLELAKKYQSKLTKVREAEKIEAVLCLLSAKQNGNTIEATDLLERACKLDEKFVPAALDLAKIFSDSGQDKKAKKVLMKCWSHTGNFRCLEEVYNLASVEDDERLKIGKDALKMFPERWDSFYIFALACVRAGVWVNAEQYIIKAWGLMPTQSLLTMAEQCEKNSDAIVEIDKTQVLKNPFWLCGHCGHKTDDWHALCPLCEGINTLK